MENQAGKVPSERIQQLARELYEWCREEARKELAIKLNEPKTCSSCRKTRSLADFGCVGQNKWDRDCRLCRRVELLGVDDLNDRDKETYGHTELCGLCGHHFPRKYLSQRESIRWGIVCNTCQNLIDRNRHKHLSQTE